MECPCCTNNLLNERVLMQSPRATASTCSSEKSVQQANGLLEQRRFGEGSVSGAGTFKDASWRHCPQFEEGFQNMRLPCQKWLGSIRPLFTYWRGYEIVEPQWPRKRSLLSYDGRFNACRESRHQPAGSSGRIAVVSADGDEVVADLANCMPVYVQ